LFFSGPPFISTDCLIGPFATSAVVLILMLPFVWEEEQMLWLFDSLIGTIRSRRFCGVLKSLDAMPN
jgi:hypothetical protein